MTGRGTLYLLLAVVAGAAATLSFAALRDLALLCGFTHGLAWLLPVVVDAGAAAGSLVWLGPAAGAQARRFARRLALGLLGLSVAANALGHGLDAYQLAPPWWVVVVLSGIAPAVLGAMVHLAVLVSHAQPAHLDAAPGGLDEPARSDVQTDPASDAVPETSLTSVASTPVSAAPDVPGRVAALIAAGAGRRRLSRELGVTEYEARQLLEHARPPTSMDAAADTATAGVAADALSFTPSGAPS